MSNAGIARMPRTLGIILRIVRPKGIECAPVTDTGKYAIVFIKNSKNIISMNTETLIKIREWEAERDRNLRIHYPLVAAKFQRWIDRAKKEDGNKNTNNKKGGNP